MNSVQALAIAAAALAISGDAHTGLLAKAQARLTTLAAHVETLVSEVTTAPSTVIEVAAEPPCEEGVYDDKDDYADEDGDDQAVEPRRGLPDAMVHWAYRAARL